ncbi:NADP-dependent oxidoreductase [Amnibacterium soli]|jgi:NADPH:quinone reductase-like Zn-dependent oxidoreductase|uniref:NADP-dependent oxidoreductase n=1 Tax=Amnibacterium soli TaxID=1282736 RepID=A0ABP8ZHY9_9MICO
MARKKAFIAVFDDYGPAEGVHVDEVDRPIPGPGEVLVQVVASGVSHMDAYIREGRFRDALALELPARQGVSFAGIVRAVGSDVPHLAPGVDVLGHDPRHGAHATHVVVPAGALVRRPARLSWEVAGALYLVGLTAYDLVQGLRLGSDDVVLVSAAAGGVGHIECQLARLAGARVIGIAGRENHDYLRSIGVRPVAYGDDLAAAIRKAAEERPVTALLDNYGHYEQLAEELGVPAGRTRTSDDRRAVEIQHWSAGPDERVALQLADVAELVASWDLKVLVSGYYPFMNLVEALVDLDARHSRGVVVVGMSPTAPAREYLGQKLRARYEATAPATS